MRKIVQAAVPSKRSTAALLCGLVLVFCGGCGDREQSAGDKETTGPAPDVAVQDETAAQGMAYEIHQSALMAFLNAVRQLESGQRVRSDEYERIFSQPAYRMIYGENGTGEFNAIIMQNVMEHVFAPNLAASVRPPKMKRYVLNYGYIADRLEAAANLADSLQTLGTVTRAMERAYPFVPEFRRPETLHLHLTATTPQITWYPPNALILDVGLAMAAGFDQLEDMIAATLVRSLAPPAPPLPQDAADGAEAMRSTMRKLHHEGIVNLIEKYPTFRLDVDHPIYRTPDINRPRAIIMAASMIERMNLMFATLLDPDSGQLAVSGSSVDDLLQLGRQYESTGYAMNRLIIDRLGADRFREAAMAGPAAWLTAYQDAAIMGGASGELGNMPPFDEVALTRLLALLDR